MPQIYVAGTADTKGAELQFLAARIRALGAEPLVIDVGIHTPSIAVDISARDVAAHGTEPVFVGDRGAAVTAMSAAFAAFVLSRPTPAAILGIGGSGGTAIVTAGMRSLPIGIPKLMVSTLASGDVAPYVGVSDIVMMPAITDLAGLNRISRIVLDNAARAIVAMSAARPAETDSRPALGLTMFGVTTPAVTQIAESLREAFDPLVFHATGTGGATMEALAESGLLSGVLDITTTEVADLMFGGVLPARPTRFDFLARSERPYVGSVGACDMVNFWAPETVPPRYAGRRFHRHNPNVTLMRTTPDECRAIGAWIGGKLERATAPLAFMVPEEGVSALDIEGGDFWDPEADAALFDAIEEAVTWTDRRQLVRLPFHINDPRFSEAAVVAFRDLWATA